MLNRVFSAAVVAAFCLPLFAVSGEPSGEAAGLIAKHQAYVGWHVGDGALKTLRATGTATRGEKVVSNFELLRLGLAHRDTSVSEHGVSYASGFTGSVPWTSSENGFTVRVVGEVVRFLYDFDAIFGELTGSEAFHAALLRHTTIKKTATAVVRLTSDVGFPLDVYVDPETGGYLRVVIDPDGKYERQFDAIEYVEIGGKRYISNWRTDDPKTVWAYTKIEPNALVDAASLHPPAQTATWSFGEGTAPMTVTKGTWQRIYVDATINGVKGRFILDSGADGTYVLDSFLRRAGAARFGKQNVWGMGGVSTGNLFRVDTISIGPSALHNVIVNSGIDEDQFVSMGVVGLIGFDLFAAAVVELDLDAGTIRVMDPALVEPDDADGLVLRVDLSDGHIRVPMTLNDTRDVIATLDTGSPAFVLFSTDMVTRDNLPFYRMCDHLKSLTLGPVRYDKPMACQTNAFARNEILVGMDFLKHFNYVVDYSRGIVVLRTRKNP